MSMKETVGNALTPLALSGRDLGGSGDSPDRS